MPPRPAFHSIARHGILTTLLFSLIACGAPTASPTPIPAAAPTATTAPAPSPAPTTAPPTIAATVSLAKAIAQTQVVERYRMTFTVIATDPNASGPDAEQVIIHQDGVFRDADFAVVRNAAPGQRGPGQEVTRADGRIYARGQLPFPSANPFAWYTFGSTPPAELPPPLTLALLLTALTERIDLDELTPAGTIDLDGQVCERFTGGLPVALGMLDGLGTPTTDEARAAEATPVVERMEAQGFQFRDAAASIDVCPNGYVYAVRSEVTISRADAPDSTTRSTLELTLDDINGDIGIPVPPDPLPFDPAGTPPVRAFALEGGAVYSAPDASSSVIAELRPTSLVVVLAQSADGAWYQVQTVQGMQGWMPTSAINFGPDATPVVPIAPAPGNP